jgi:glycosyltransferase involved in cell wall biosynthesis
MSGLVVQEWMESVGGAERVVKSVLNSNTNTQLFCLWSDSQDPDLQGKMISESWLARTPLAQSKGLALPFMPITWKYSKFKMNPEWVFVSSHLFAHHASLNPDLRSIPGINYIHSPARYIWNPDLDDRANNLILKSALPTLRSLDKSRARKSSYKFVANSQNVQNRIDEAWGIESEIIYPPVRVRELQDLARKLSKQPHENNLVRGLSLPTEFLIGVGRFIPYKKLDEVIKTAAKMGLPAVLIGSGSLENSYRQLAAELGVRLFILSGLSDKQVAETIHRSSALVFGGVEDFGIVPVEAMAMGVPVIAKAKGGALETVIDGLGGVLVENFSSDDVVEMALQAINLPKDRIASSVKKFDEAVFLTSINELIGSMS